MISGSADKSICIWDLDRDNEEIQSWCRRATAIGLDFGRCSPMRARVAADDAGPIARLSISAKERHPCAVLGASGCRSARLHLARCSSVTSPCVMNASKAMCAAATVGLSYSCPRP